METKQERRNPTVKELLESRGGVPVAVKVNPYIGKLGLFTNDILYLSPAQWKLYQAAIEDNDQAALDNLSNSIEIVVLRGLNPEGFFMVPMR